MRLAQHPVLVERLGRPERVDAFGGHPLDRPVGDATLERAAVHVAVLVLVGDAVTAALFLEVEQQRARRLHVPVHFARECSQAPVVAAAKNRKRHARTTVNGSVRRSSIHAATSRAAS